MKKKANTLEFDPTKGPMNEQISDILDECFHNVQKLNAFGDVVRNLFAGKVEKAKSPEGKREALRQKNTAAKNVARA